MKVFDSASAYEFMEVLVEQIGNRESATDSELKAAERIRGWFEEFGLSNVRLEEFEVVTSRILREEATLPRGEKIKCTALGNSLSTPQEGVEGEVTMLEMTSQEELKKIEGKIVAVNTRPNKEKFIKIARAKPLALIIPSATTAVPAFYGSISPEYTEKMNIPIVSIAYDDLLSVIKKPQRLRILTEVEVFRAKSRNVIGELHGEIEDEEILVGGHYDTVRKVKGAFDNAAGAAIVLELARVLAREKSTRTIKFVAFGSEELGMRGSLHYIQNEENTKNVRFYLNLDGQGILVGTDSAVVVGPNDLKTLLQLAAKELGIILEVSTDVERSAGSDHLSLALSGVPSAGFLRYGGATPVVHTDLEDLRWCGPEAFASVGKLCQTLVTRMANAGDFPFEKRIPEKTSKQLEKRFCEWGREKRKKAE